MADQSPDQTEITSDALMACYQADTDTLWFAAKKEENTPKSATPNVPESMYISSSGHSIRTSQLEGDLSLERSYPSALERKVKALERANLDLRKQLSVAGNTSASKTADQLSFAVDVATRLEGEVDAKTMTIWKLLAAIEGTVEEEEFMNILYKATTGQKVAYDATDLLHLLSEGPRK